ncbi:DUF805 domain-containing protein [Stakelama tenebrarum]|uniref:DUF805 domain-containing protein n=1 Tax=Stakelama tenebrarum TaxID=2711215 RepID=A0A6G6Y638_9SPHN|nr:DUF805 domain-containing protein [Sphingosinithalassobacter tenebrarum]QIG80311.1 DUF805 domain-containing protein [Sphingosinithalassobacter tenebrarum]
MYLASLRHNLGGILRFSGRSSREFFWPYALTLLGVTVAATILVMAPAMFRMSETYAREHPEQVVETVGPGGYSIEVKDPPPDLFRNIDIPLTELGIVGGLFLLLLAAAVTRRLHDRGLPGILGILPLIPFSASAFYFMPRIFHQFALADGSPPTAFVAAFFCNLLYLGLLLGLGLLLAMKGQPQSNRYGDPPEPGRGEATP